MYRSHGHHGRSLVFRDSKDPVMPCRVKVRLLVCNIHDQKVVVCLPLMLNSVTAAFSFLNVRYAVITASSNLFLIVSMYFSMLL